MTFPLLILFTFTTCFFDIDIYPLYLSLLIMTDHMPRQTLWENTAPHCRSRRLDSPPRQASLVQFHPHTGPKGPRHFLFPIMFLVTL
jgi:hypothetical protein